MNLSWPRVENVLERPNQILKRADCDGLVDTAGRLKRQGEMFKSEPLDDVIRLCEE